MGIKTNLAIYSLGLSRAQRKSSEVHLSLFNKLFYDAFFRHY